MILNESADWSKGEINISPEMIKHFWVPDIAIHDLVRSGLYFVHSELAFYFIHNPRFTKPEVLQESAALEIVRDHSLYYKLR